MRRLGDNWEWASAKMDHRYFTVCLPKGGHIGGGGGQTCFPNPQLWFSSSHSTWGCVKSLQFIVTAAYCWASPQSLCASNTIRMYTRVNWPGIWTCWLKDKILFIRIKCNESPIMTHSFSPQCHCLPNPDPFNMMVWDSECQVTSNICCSPDPISKARGHSGHISTGVEKTFQSKKELLTIKKVWCL